MEIRPFFGLQGEFSLTDIDTLLGANLSKKEKIFSSQ